MHRYYGNASRFIECDLMNRPWLDDAPDDTRAEGDGLHNVVEAMEVDETPLQNYEAGLYKRPMQMIRMHETVPE